MNRIRPPWLLLLLIGAVALLAAEFWSSTPYFVDAGIYRDCVELGRPIAHPPGYLLFVALGRLLHLSVQNSYLCNQLLGFGSYIASIPVLYLALRRWIQPAPATALAAAYALSWTPLLMSTVGTSHATDLLMGALLVLVIGSHSLAQGKPIAIWTLVALAAVTSALRPSTLLMWSPALLVLLLRFPRNIHVWLGFIFLAASALALTTLSAHLFPVWYGIPFSEAVHALDKVNAHSSPLLSGINKATLFNVFRTLLWTGIQFSFLPLLWLLAGKIRCDSQTSCDPIDTDSPELFQRRMLLSAFAGPILVMALYLATHPGYLAPAIPPGFALAALLWPSSGSVRFRRANIVLGLYLITSLTLFYGMRIIIHPSNTRDAVANGLLLQYSRDGLKRSTMKTVSEWLLESGHPESVPPHRLEQLETARH